MSVRIIVDSTADLLPKIRQQVQVVPLTVHFGDEEYVDGVTITHKEFYEKLVTGDAMPSTSQASPAAFQKEFEKVSKAGDSAVVITVASKLSGTYQSACIAAGDYENIYVVDSESVAIGSGILTERALDMVRQGLDAAQIAQKLEEEKQQIRVLAVVDTLEYLKRGGRVSKAVAFAGGLLNIKPVLGIVRGEILMLGKARGLKQANTVLAEEVAKTGGVDFRKPVLLGYTGAEDTAMLRYMEDSRALWEPAGDVRYTMIGSVIGTHAGPGAVAVAYFAK